MALIDEIPKWEKKKVLIIGDSLVDKYIHGFTDRISPDAPVPNVKIEENHIYIGAIGLVARFVKSLGGIPEVCTIIGNDFEGDFFIKKVTELQMNTSGILVEETVKTPQITRIKAMNQHLLRLETDYNEGISENIKKKFIDLIKNRSSDIDSIIILDYGLGGLFDDLFIRRLMEILSDYFQNKPIIVRPSKTNYFLYENVDLIRMNLQKALDTFSIDCCNETSITIAGKRILNSSKCKNVILNYLESDSFLFSRELDTVEKINPILQQPVRSYVAVGSVIMAVLGLSLASNISVIDAVRLALFAAGLVAVLPTVEFFNSKKLTDFLQSKLDKL
ncbi:hypothetical protein LCGC14_1147410 [marine sediment metagenome]|uniref:Carbohydrate kinase PfkB domain-containing protein n=1 Tax=marine sediment metagenome TaxID=412755 RepID=A0A0F9MJS8_9ZZZZ|nr:hypothetical protein [archaeon]